MMNEYLKLKKSNCKNCYKCIRHCPVKAIKFSGNQAHIVEDECILCGQCFVACPQNAKEVRNDITKAKTLIRGGNPVVCSVAPSFVANYEGATIRTIEKALQKLGFTSAGETAEGAADVKSQYDKMISQNKQDVIISSCCHTVNLLIQKYYPEALAFLAPVISPMQAHCMSIKAKDPNAKTVFIGPCISKKAEADKIAEAVDCVLTFEELTEWMNEEGITVEAEQNTNKSCGKSSLFPTTGGILRSMKCENPEYCYLTVDGIENCMNAIKDIAEGNMSKCFIEMSACAGSCIGGPTMDKGRRAPIRDYLAVNNYASNNELTVQNSIAATTPKSFQYIGLNRVMPGSVAVEEILKKMGKTKPEDELNCGSCGYNTCRDKAVAVLFGKADLSMCLPFLKEKAESFSDNIIHNTPNAIIVLNESLEVQQINKAACKLMNIANRSNILGDQVVRILDPAPFFDVLQSGRNIRNRRIYLAEYKKYVDLTVIFDKSYHILMVLMRDVTEEENHRAVKEKISRQTIETTDKVVEKQMRVVQEIASLLGETAAETKIALAKLKESLSDE